MVANPTVGTQLKELRNRLGFTQEDLAEILGIALGTLKGYEASGVEPPPQRQRLIIRKTGVDAGFVLGVENAEFWGPQVRSCLRQVRKELASGIRTPGTYARRASFVLRRIRELCPEVHPGIWAAAIQVRPDELEGFCREEGDPVVGGALEALSQFVGVPVVWFATGEPADMGVTEERRDRWEYANRRCEEVGIEPKTIVDNLALLASIR